MSKRSLIKSITPLPPPITREIALAFLHDHIEMIELNPLVIRHERTSSPPNATLEEQYNCKWYEITDNINYLPGGAVKGEISYKGGFYDLPNGLQTHVFAPAGVDLKTIWQVKGNMPGERPEPQEIGSGAPKEGLYLQEDVEVKCNIFLMAFVKRNLKKSHDVLVRDLVQKASDTQGEKHMKAQRTNSGHVSTRSHSETSSPRYLSNTLTPITSMVSQPRSSATSKSSTPVQAEASCKCPDLHHPMCPNYRYIPPSKPAQGMQDQSYPRAQIPIGSGTATSASQVNSYSPAGMHPHQAPPQSLNSLMPSRAAQSYADQAELPASNMTNARDATQSQDGTIAELDGSEIAYWKQVMELEA